MILFKRNEINVADAERSIDIMLFQDGGIRIAIKLPETIVKSPRQDIQCFLIAPHINPLPVANGQDAQLVYPVALIGMFMGPDNAVEPIDTSIQQLFADVRRGVNQHLCLFVFHKDGTAATAVFLLLRVTGAPFITNARNPARGAASEDCYLH